jgi:hypothetical protein
VATDRAVSTRATPKNFWNLTKALEFLPELKRLDDPCRCSNQIQSPVDFCSRPKHSYEWLINSILPLSDKCWPKETNHRKWNQCTCVPKSFLWLDKSEHS